MASARFALLLLGLLIQAIRLGAGLAIEGAEHSQLLGITGVLTGGFVSGAIGYLLYVETVAKVPDPLREVGTWLLFAASVVLLSVSHLAVVTEGSIAEMLKTEWLEKNAPAVIYAVVLSLAIEIAIALIARSSAEAAEPREETLPRWEDIEDPDKAKPEPIVYRAERECRNRERGCPDVFVKTSEESQSKAQRSADKAELGHQRSCKFRSAAPVAAEQTAERSAQQIKAGAQPAEERV